MKTLANCNPIEFLQQTNRIRKSVATYLKDTGIFEIRKNLPNIDKDKVSKEEYQKALREQSKKNISDMFDRACEEYPKETAEILGMMCFIDPKDIANYKGVDFLKPAIELLSDEDVVSFFTALMN